MKSYRLISVIAMMSLMVTAQASNLYLPHYTTVNETWSTLLTLNNLDSSKQEVTLEFYSVSGELANTVSLVLNSREGRTLDLAEDIDGIPDKGWIKIDTDRDKVKGLMTFEFLPTGGISSLPLIKEVGSALILSSLVNDIGTVSGFALVNTSQVEGTARLILESLDGSKKEEKNLVIPAGAKTVSLLTDFFEEVPEKGRMRILGTASMCGFALTFKGFNQQIVAVPADIWEPGDLPQLESALKRAVNSDFPGGAIISTETQDIPLTVATAGYASVEEMLAMRPGEQLEIGSITKTFVAALTLQFHEEGLLTLQQPLSTWYPHLEKSQNITVEMLLNHGSGIPNYTDLVTFWEEAVTVEGRAWDTEAILGYAFQEPFVFEPGTSGSYSNTNYVLLGAIIEKIAGKPFYQVLNSRLLEPLAMTDTFIYGDPNFPLKRGQTYQYNNDNQEFANFTDHPNLSWAAAAGAMISTAEDLKIWAKSLYGGQVLAPETLQLMFTRTNTLAQGSTYGLGVVVYNPFQTGLNEKGYGHDGATLGCVASLLYFPDSKKVVVGFQNHRQGPAVNSQFSDILLTGLQLGGLVQSKTKPNIPFLDRVPAAILRY